VNWQAQAIPVRREPVVSSAVLGTLIFVICEAMLFAGFMSAHAIVRTSDLGAWPPPGQPRLPVQETAFNTLALLASGVLLWQAQRALRRAPDRAPRFLLGAMGLTLTASNHGSFFYLIVGAHALHAIAALIALGYVYRLLRSDRLVPERFHAAGVFWYFVVGLWPILYVQVYL
jgi:heme/copper-type cytochrome/quinol oxidase subunit 3